MYKGSICAGGVRVKKISLLQYVVVGLTICVIVLQRNLFQFHLLEHDNQFSFKDRIFVQKSKSDFTSTIADNRQNNDPKSGRVTYVGIVNPKQITSECLFCLSSKEENTNCDICASECPVFCNALCKVDLENKVTSKSIVITPPPTETQNESRLIPRIIHQTYFEYITPEKYPNWSRLVMSWKLSGWEYRFYTDEMITDFLKTNFPPEVLEAYNALKPGAFKADLFRYCILLMHGGVYADVDIMLQSNLESIIDPDVGFMIPLDEPGASIGQRMCLWNGLIAAAPGHPFLAMVVEMVVNNVRNRFTSIELDNLFCPNPELSVLHAYDLLFITGPCILGAAVNKVLGRHGQAPFLPGELDLQTLTDNGMLGQATEFVLGTFTDSYAKIPGRVVFLEQNKHDMTYHRFMHIEKNALVAATDFPTFQRSTNVGNEDTPYIHYSKTRNKQRVYGVDKLYTDHVVANESIEFLVTMQGDVVEDKAILTIQQNKNTATDTVRWKPNSLSKIKCVDMSRNEQPVNRIIKEIIANDLILERGEFVCLQGGRYRFGLDNTGNFGYFVGWNMVWTPREVENTKFDYWAFRENGLAVFSSRKIKHWIFKDRRRIRRVRPKIIMNITGISFGKHDDVLWEFNFENSSLPKPDW